MTEVVRSRRWLAAMVWLVLALSAAVLVLDDLRQASGVDDTENLETPLAAVVSSQLVEGPQTIYGPFSRLNPRVLIHAPLFYRVSGLVAWLAAALGVSAGTSGFVGGRSVSWLSFAGVTAVVYRMARLEGGTVRAGAWAALLVGSSRLIGPYSITTRPDLLGAFFQTMGVFGVLRVFDGAPPRRLIPAYVAFALAVCVKQNDVMAAAASSALLCAAWFRHRDWRRSIERGFLSALVVVAVYFLAEELVTSGQMSWAVFELPARFGRLAPGGLNNVPLIALVSGQRSAPLFALGLGCLVASPRALARTRIDAMLWLYLVLELIMMEALSYGSAGAWVNYAIQAVIFASVLLGRALARIVEGRVRFWRVVPLVILAAWMLATELRADLENARSQTENHGALLALLRHPLLAGQLRDSVYFVGLPQYNRIFGSARLAHDEWLYGLFERTGSAEPRTSWLREALTGPVRKVIVPRDPPFVIPLNPPVVPGLTESLPDLGYDPVGEVGRFRLWERRRPPASAGSTPFGR